MKSKEKTEYINLLYIIGSLLVVLGHSTIHYLGNWGGVNLVDSNLAVIINNFIYSFHMPLFFMLAGFMFRFNLKKGKYQDFIPFVVNKFERLIVPYLFIGLFYVAPYRLLVENYSFEYYIPYVFNDIFLGFAPSQLWFLLTLFIIFMIYYFFRKFVDKYRYNLIVNILIFVVLTIVKNYYISSGLFQIHQVFNYLVYFHLGYVLCLNPVLHKFLTRKYKLLILTHILLFVLSRFIRLPQDDYIMSIIGSFAIYTSAVNLNDKLYIVKKFKIYKLMGKYNLEIYLFHQQIILLMLQSPDFKALHPFITITSSFFISIIISVIFAIALNIFKQLLEQVKNTFLHTKSI